MKYLICFYFLFLSFLSQAQEIELVKFATGFKRPVDIQNAGDNRLFIVEQAGVIRIQDGARVLTQPFLDIKGSVNSRGNEQGLLGLAFHPQFKANGSFFVNYTNLDGNTTISRFTINSGNPNLANPMSEEILLVINQPWGNHNGGGLQFGPDGYLYIGTGDGGSANDPKNAGQSLNTLLGKLLRIDVNSTTDYKIPESNPFFDNSNAKPEIWAYGLRNPWRFSFDQKTGDLWIADVGQNAWEEVHMTKSESKGGENYGWRCYEGKEKFNERSCNGLLKMEDPVFVFSHGEGCSITGGYVYRGQDFPELQGRYFFTDFCSGNIWSTDQELNTIKHGQFAKNQYSTFGLDSTGEIYLAALYSGVIYKLQMK